MAIELQNSELMKVYAERGRAITVLQRAFRGDRRGEHKLADQELGKNNRFLEEWEEGDLTTTKHILDQLTEAQAHDQKLIEELANKATATASSKAGLALTEAAEKEHGQKSDEELVTARNVVMEKIIVLQNDLKLIHAEISRRAKLESLRSRLGVVTDTDRALLERLIKTDHIPSKTKVTATGAN